jgi:hypothetical protein
MERDRGVPMLDENLGTEIRIGGDICSYLQSAKNRPSNTPRSIRIRMLGGLDDRVAGIDFSGEANAIASQSLRGIQRFVGTRHQLNEIF